MSTAAHEPRRVGPRRADSPSGSKVTPRRNAPEAGDPNGLQYDSDELPVLIRLPNLRDMGTVETRPVSTTQKKHRIDQASASHRKTSKQDSSNAGKRSFQQQAGNNKLVVVGIAGGILAVVMLFFFNTGGTKPATDQDGWASEAAKVTPSVQSPEPPLAAEIGPPPPFPDFVYEAPNREPAQYASGQSEQAPVGVPMLHERQAPLPSETAALPSQSRAITAWPSDEEMGPPSPSESKPKSLWPGEALGLEPGGYEYAPTDSSGQTDYRSSMNPSQSGAYRMGKLESDHQPATQGGPSSILNGNIEIPDTTSIR